MSSSNFWKKLGFGAAITGGVIAGIGLLPISLGFGTAGIIGGSVATGIQAAGSIFALCTSLGIARFFASNAAVGSNLGEGGATVYLTEDFSPEKDAKLIFLVIKKKDNPEIIIKLLESRTQSQIEEIRKEYNKLGENLNFDIDIINYFPDSLKEYVLFLLIRESNDRKRKKKLYAIAICYKPDFEHTYDNEILI